ncbi:hypothetical protein PF011_g30896 [Phytophthora fragariae]|uniref:DDE Tnp4 domain-containing protein n=1 Tax=Phytophthora fragariae TaxID=53985 RepID=A0A6A3GMC2_9STRA|nr:hypothetical protein PF011_g30896 [Phytophthora fragariae]
MEQSSLSMLFGVPPSTLSSILLRGEDALSKALHGYAPARISWPSPTRQAELAKLVEAREPLLKYTFGFIDGKNFKVRTICFAADGCTIWSRHNCPGSWNDSDTSLGFRVKLLDPAFCPDPRMNVVSDSAFPSSTAMTERILTPLKDGDLERILPSLRASARALHNAITSVRQAAEWGMGSVQKIYSRLNLPLPYDPKLRDLRLDNLFRMAKTGSERWGSRRYGPRLRLAIDAEHDLNEDEDVSHEK